MRCAHEDRSRRPRIRVVPYFSHARIDEEDFVLLLRLSLSCGNSTNIRSQHFVKTNFGEDPRFFRTRANGPYSPTKTRNSTVILGRPLTRFIVLVAPPTVYFMYTFSRNVDRRNFFPRRSFLPLSELTRKRATCHRRDNMRQTQERNQEQSILKKSTPPK